jgi:hypothetical protein
MTAFIRARENASEQWYCWIGRRRTTSASAENRGNSCQRKHPAEILALGRAAPPTVAARTRIVSVAGIRLDHQNLCDLSKGYFATTFLSSSPPTQPCSPVSTDSKMALHRAIASFVAREGHRPPGSNELVVDLRQDRDQTNPGCRQW